jgi:hypothetical protein
MNDSPMLITRLLQVFLRHYGETEAAHEYPIGVQEPAAVAAGVRLAPAARHGNPLARVVARAACAPSTAVCVGKELSPEVMAYEERPLEAREKIG